MKKIILLSDTHSHVDNRIIPYLQKCDQLWHAGDIGDPLVLETLKKHVPVRAVYGNIDDHTLRNELPEVMEWEIEGVSILMTHIGGRPPKFEKGIKDLLLEKKPRIFVCGHSHILFIQYWTELNCLLLNPGACGKSGWHKKQTLLRFEIDKGDIKNMEVIELDRRLATSE